MLDFCSCATMASKLRTRKTDYGHSVWQQAAGPTVFTPFAMDTDYFGSKQQVWMEVVSPRTRIHKDHES
jgi:hypothetical protein